MPPNHPNSHHIPIGYGNQSNIFMQQTVTRNQTIVNGVVQEYTEEMVSTFNPNLFASSPSPSPYSVEEATHTVDVDDDSEGSISFGKIREIMESLGMNQNDCSIEVQPNGSLELKFKDVIQGSASDPEVAQKNREIHFKVLQHVMEHMFLQQISQQAHQTSNQMIGEFTVLHQNLPLTTYEYSYEDEDSDDEDDEDLRPDYFIDDKLINKIVGKAEKIKKDDPLIVNEEECYICFEKYKERELKRKLPKCNHYFHKKCIDKWLKSKSTCPHCRCDLMEDVTLEDEDLMRYFKCYHCKCQTDHSGNTSGNSS
jgi:Ring finger domain